MPCELPLRLFGPAVSRRNHPSRAPAGIPPPRSPERVPRAVEPPNSATGCPGSLVRAEFLVKNFTNFSAGASARGAGGPLGSAQTLPPLLTRRLLIGNRRDLGHRPGDAVEDVVLAHDGLLRPDPLHDRQ